MIDDFENVIHRCIERYMAGRYHMRAGLVSSFDPKSHTAKVLIQPEGEETGNAPIHALHIGNGFGVMVGLTPAKKTGGSEQNQTGDQVIVGFLDGDFEAPRIIGRLHSDVDKPPPVKAGEILLKHEKGGSIFASDSGTVTWTGGKGQALLNKQDKPVTAISAPGAPGSGLDDSSGAVDGGQSIATDAEGNFKVTGLKGQTGVYDKDGKIIKTGMLGQSQTFDEKGNVNFSLQPKQGQSGGDGFSFLVDALKDITHKAGGSQTRQAGTTISDVAANITHSGNTTVAGTLGVSQLLSALGGAQIGIASFTVDKQGRLSSKSFAPETGDGSIGDIIYRDADHWQVVSPGPVGNILTTGGAGSPPTWQPPSGGSANYIGEFFVADLPASPAIWSTATAIDAPKVGETSGTGTGCPVYFQGFWRVFSSDHPVDLGGGPGGGSGASGTNYIGAYTVASLPAAPPNWRTATATDGRKVGEGAGLGTGVPVYFSGATQGWRVLSSDQPVTA